jgi:tetratricopeptide (TPR) repeat protein
VDASTSVIDSLEERVRRYPAERYPVQHATAQFHLGVALANAGRTSEAEQALQAAVLYFDRAVLPLEHAKALNALGAALRGNGRLDEAASAFRQAAAVFASSGERRERGAAMFNLGLVERQRERPDDAAACFTQAAQLLGAARGAALRELGGLLLERGEVAAATAVLEDAISSHAEVGEELAYGAAANALGLAHLAVGRTDDAIVAFRDALGAYPRTTRPHEFAMVKANLALAYEDAEDLPRARLAARQALSVREPPTAVTAQARAVLARNGPVTDDVLVVLADEPAERWPLVLREEVAQWKRGDAEALVTASPSPDLIEAWLGALLELPPGEMERAIETTLLVADGRFVEAVRAVLPRFHHPQMLRLEAAFGWSSQAT